MNANPRKPAPVIRTLSIAALSLTLLAAGCVPPPRAPAPAPAPVPSPAPPASPVPVAKDWRDAPVTPGTWQWNRIANGSLASFAGGQFSMRCDPEHRTITLLRTASSVADRLPMSITTTQTTRELVAIPVEGGVAATIASNDPLLDAMAFSRGRFVVTVAGNPALYIPSWTEISRVVEDCR